MERRVGTKIDAYIVSLKDDISSKIRELKDAAANATMSSLDPNQTQNTKALETIDKLCQQLTSFVYEYEKLKLGKEDFMKRKRVKNIVPSQFRCHAKRANGEQCTRKKKSDCDYCGTHTKGAPNSIMDDDASSASEAQKSQQQNVNVWVQNIKGIEYFIDSNNNVYKHEDVIENATNPQVIAKCRKNESGNYLIDFT